MALLSETLTGAHIHEYAGHDIGNLLRFLQYALAVLLVTSGKTAHELRSRNAQEESANKRVLVC